LVWSNNHQETEWKGTTTRSSEVLPVGTYFYVIQLNDAKETTAYKGYIQLIK
jgi:hypothetical protein